MPTRHDHYINNQWESGAGPLFISRDPATEDILWQGYSATEKEVDSAITAARSAFGEWSSKLLEERIGYLDKYRNHLVSNIEPLAEIISKETGKPLWESKGEVSAMVNKIGISVQAYNVRCAVREPEYKAGRLITRHRPHGVIAVFGPFNFPGHLPNGHIVPALLAGNTVIFKPSEYAPLTAEFIMHCWEKCALPSGVMNMLQGARETGRLLAGHPNIDGLFFTGSWETGLILSEQFGKHPEKILALEMGGNNPLVFDEVDDLKTAAYITVQSAFLTSGQRCSCARRLIVPEGKKGDQFIDEVVKLMKGIKVGHYTEIPEPFMGPVISEAAARHLLSVQDTLKYRGGKVLVEMHLLKVDSAIISPGLMDVTEAQNRPDEEIFGPFLQVIRVPDFAAAIEEANATSYGLTAGLLSTNEEHYRQFYQRIRAGIINWNVPLTGASSAVPFGGVGRSGNCRPSAFYAADYCAFPVSSIEAKNLVMPETLTPGITIPF
jgi:succinylglutamic semialdehyde dehydrogenase